MQSRPSVTGAADSPIFIPLSAIASPGANTAIRVAAMPSRGHLLVLVGDQAETAAPGQQIPAMASSLIFYPEAGDHGAPYTSFLLSLEAGTLRAEQIEVNVNIHAEQQANQESASDSSVHEARLLRRLQAQNGQLQQHRQHISEQVAAPAPLAGVDVSYRRNVSMHPFSTHQAVDAGFALRLDGVTNFLNHSAVPLTNAQDVRVELWFLSGDAPGHNVALLQLGEQIIVSWSASSAFTVVANGRSLTPASCPIMAPGWHEATLQLTWHASPVSTRHPGYYDITLQLDGQSCGPNAAYVPHLGNGVLIGSSTFPGFHKFSGLVDSVRVWTYMPHMLCAATCKPRIGEEANGSLLLVASLSFNKGWGQHVVDGVTLSRVRIEGDLSRVWAQPAACARAQVIQLPPNALSELILTVPATARSCAALIPPGGLPASGSLSVLKPACMEPEACAVTGSDLPQPLDGYQLVLAAGDPAVAVIQDRVSIAFDCGHFSLGPAVVLLSVHRHKRPPVINDLVLDLEADISDSPWYTVDLEGAAQDSDGDEITYYVSHVVGGARLFSTDCDGHRKELLCSSDVQRGGHILHVNGSKMIGWNVSECQGGAVLHVQPTNLSRRLVVHVVACDQGMQCSMAQMVLQWPQVRS
jgi:hypothetical protein